MSFQILFGSSIIKNGLDIILFFFSPGNKNRPHDELFRFISFITYVFRSNARLNSQQEMGTFIFS